MENCNFPSWVQSTKMTRKPVLVLCIVLCCCGFIALAVPDAKAGKKGWITFDQVKGSPYQVSYDKRSLKINGLHSLFLSGSVHPPRSTPPMWDSILQTAVANGLNMVSLPSPPKLRIQLFFCKTDWSLCVLELSWKRRREIHLGGKGKPLPLHWKMCTT